MRAIILIVLATTLAGCATQADRRPSFAAIDDSECKNNGGQPGTPAYLQCRAQLDAARAQAKEIAAAEPAWQGKGQ
jgi:hypothetical protein